MKSKNYRAAILLNIDKCNLDGVKVLEELIKILNSNLTLKSTEIIGDTIYLHMESVLPEFECLYCCAKSARVHSRYVRDFQDLSIQKMKTIIVLNNRKLFNDNPDCTHWTFAESFGFIKPTSKK